jgi:hypothetical protein
MERKTEEQLLVDILKISEIALDCLADAILMTKPSERTTRAMYARQSEEIRTIRCKRMGEMQDLQREKMKGANHVVRENPCPDLNDQGRRKQAGRDQN